MRDNLTLFNEAEAQVFGISVDSPFVLDRFKSEQQLNFPLLSDFNKTVSAAYGALYEHFVYDMDGVSKRASFVIDAACVVQFAEVLGNASELPDFKAILNCLSDLK